MFDRYQGEVKGLFSHAVLSILKSGRLTGSQLRDCVFNHLRELVNENEYQEPEFVVDPNNDIVFSEAAEPARLPVKISFSAETRGHNVEIEDSDFKSHGIHKATARSWKLDLELGKYRIRDHVANRDKIFRILGGDTINVEF